MQDRTEAAEKEIHISVRGLVEFILRHGDIDNRHQAAPDNAMQEGGRIHRMIQRRMGTEYQTEVSLKYTVPAEGYTLVVEGRADGIIHQKDQVIIDEIKGTYRDITRMKEPRPLHLAQAKCYAFMYGIREGLTKVKVRLTYCNIYSEEIRYFYEDYTFEELEEWFGLLVRSYRKWADYSWNWSNIRQASIQGLAFPFPYRQGQKELVANVYRTIYHKKKLFLEAPTGVGKTISVLYPAIQAMGRGMGDKIFYLTAKTITRTVADDTLVLLRGKGLHVKSVILTAKDKICFMDNVDCNPESCPYAKGHYDRINDAVFDLLTAQENFGRENIEKYAMKYQVCPFEMCLDMSLYADVIICDYNYLFDPHIYLKRFFGEASDNYIFLIDEAHNLLERGGEMYSALLWKEQFVELCSEIKQTVASEMSLHPAKHVDNGVFGQISFENESHMKDKLTIMSQNGVKMTHIITTMSCDNESRNGVVKNDNEKFGKDIYINAAEKEIEKCEDVQGEEIREDINAGEGGIRECKNVEEEGKRWCEDTEEGEKRGYADVKEEGQRWCEGIEGEGKRGYADVENGAIRGCEEKEEGVRTCEDEGEIRRCKNVEEERIRENGNAGEEGERYDIYSQEDENDNSEYEEYFDEMEGQEFGKGKQYGGRSILIRQGYADKLICQIRKCNQELLLLKRECPQYCVVGSLEGFVRNLLRLQSVLDDYLSEQEEEQLSVREMLLDFYFEVNHFLYIYELVDDNYVMYTQLCQDGSFFVKLFCVNPKENLKNCMLRGRSTILFSATFLPIQYYKKLLGGEAEDYEVYAHSMFDLEKRALFIAGDVTSKYTRRSWEEYYKIAHYIEEIVKNRHGNYMVFCPSYGFLRTIYDIYMENFGGEDRECIVQSEAMSETEREEFLGKFQVQDRNILIGFCVLGGIFGEGIDLKNDRLIGVMIVGTGLPQVCDEREILKGYFNASGEEGFDYSYRFPGMNKVLQAAGRVIRTMEDVGIIALLDERFLQQSYRRLFPLEWQRFEMVTVDNIAKKVERFWDQWL